MNEVRSTRRRLGRGRHAPGIPGVAELPEDLAALGALEQVRTQALLDHRDHHGPVGSWEEMEQVVRKSGRESPGP